MIKGLQQGFQQGAQQGLQQGLQRAMLSILRKKFPTMLDAFAPRIEAMTEIEAMQNAVALLALAETPEDVRRILQTGE